ncbi:DNA-processing protein DprA [Galbitalea sp. SE-J8]|uniref:DNA-processing protein DprA n=1 Tax=Galbitalea sp. SE-J8 TaxID=3054952 RepID=UPI00259C695D|nr:DNA-processing protein DprA [Galbitalea sp. SE-J8]MDM4762896.1 DNA-processing protein DprA [Galbitalea sp. SE-J8]
MTMFGIDGTEVRSLVAAVRRPGLGDAAVREAFARAAWTGIAEPGDGDAGALVGALGATGALELLLRRPSASELAAAADLTDERAAEAVARWQPRVIAADVLRWLRQAARFNAHLVIPGDPGWPEGVDDLGSHAPVALWVRGDPDVLASSARGLALVGARASTGYGEHVTVDASAGLVERGYTIVSGAAYGIDGVAHRTALATHGRTVAFLAGGVDRFYPSGHDDLLTRIARVGAVASEVPCGVPPTKWRFLQRNRLIAAASSATVVLEAGWRSGSLNTAAHASALGRPLGAVPGPVTSATSAGCHRLVREFGATLVTTAAEMAELAPLVGPAQLDLYPERPDGARDAAEPTSDEIRVLDALAPRSSRTPHDVAVRSGLAVARAQAILGLLALDGRARETPDGWRRA